MDFQCSCRERISAVRWERPVRLCGPIMVAQRVKGISKLTPVILPLSLEPADSASKQLMAEGLTVAVKANTKIYLL